MSGNQRVNNMPSFGLRKVAFHRAKDGLLEGKRPSFTGSSAVQVYVLK